MAGDGINAPPALAQADTGIALGSGTEIAAQNAGILLQHHSIIRIAETFVLSQKTFRNIRQKPRISFLNILFIKKFSSHDNYGPNTHELLASNSLSS